MLPPIEPIHEFVEGIGYDALIEFIHMIIAGAVAFTAYKVYRVTQEKSIKMLSMGFLMLCIAYAIIGIGNITLYLQQTVFVQDTFFFIIHFGYLAAKTLGLLTLACIPLKIYDVKIYGILAALVLLCTYASTTSFAVYQIIGLLFYVVILHAYVKSYLLHHNKNTLLIALGFTSLLLAAVDFLFLGEGFIFYILGHLLEFVGYGLILVALLLAYTFQHEKRKTPNHS